jgi:nicotinate-nucleotide pyrophosphorylase (carboxylating)
MKYNYPVDFSEALAAFIKQALSEDLGTGDISGVACLNTNAQGAAQCIIKQAGVLAGVEMARLIFKHYSGLLEFTPLLSDGSIVKKGDIAFRVSGPQNAIIASERLVLNCMQRMSGIATLTHETQSLIKHTKCKILDTRKTTPNFRVAEKWGVQIGGGLNHRIGLYDMVMLKDNHIDYCGGVSQAIENTLAYLAREKRSIPVIVETRTLAEVRECFEFPELYRILLDNMPISLLREAVALVNGKIPTEASGNITKETIVPVAETGVDFISMGSITYSAGVLDISLKAVS